MDTVTFKKFKLFSGKQPLAKRSKPPDSEKKKKRGKSGLQVKDLFQSPLFWLILFVIAVSYLISYLPSRSLPQLTVGEIAGRDISAPEDLTIEDTETTMARREEAVNNVLPVYAFDPNVFLNIEEKVHQLFRMGREWAGTQQRTAAGGTEAFRKRILETFDIEVSLNDLAYLGQQRFPANLEDPLVNLLGRTMAPGVVVSKNLFIHREPELGLVIAHPQEGERSVTVSNILDLGEAKQRLSEDIGRLALSSRRKTLLTNLSGLIVAPNLTLDIVTTQTRKEQASARVEPIFYRIKKDKVIVRKGDEVTAEAVREIGIINANLRRTPSWLLNFIGTFLLFSLLFVTLWYYLKSLERLKYALRAFILLGLVLTLSLLLYKLSLFLAQTFSQSATFPLLANQESYSYAVPFQLGALIFAFLTTVPVTLVYVVINSLAVGYLFRADFFLMLYSLIGGLAAIYGVKYFQRQKRTTVLRAGLLLIAPINLFLLVCLHLIKERLAEPWILASETLMGILGGLLSAALAFVLLPFIETLFGFVTQARLSDLTNSEIPILKKLAIEAPGSYHHSLIVSTLAEKAAEAIKVDPMLVKVGALYHDIGKVKRPEYFIENRIRNIDTHKDLTPSMSRLVIVSHVKDGVEMGKKIRLPRKIQDIIEQHHGKTLVRYFYEKAKEKYDPEMQDIEKEQYRYPGPTPQSKEAAIIMLADAVEAASRSLREPTKDNLKRLIQTLFDNFLQDGELDDSGLTLSDLRTIGETFLVDLEKIHHPRISYPGFEFEKKPQTKPSGNKNDNHPKPAKKTPDKPKES